MGDRRKMADGSGTASETLITTGFIQAILCILGYYAMIFLPWVGSDINPLTSSGSTLYDLVTIGGLFWFQVGSFLLFVGLGVCLFHRRTFAIGWIMVLAAMVVMSLSFLSADLQGMYFGLGMYVGWVIALVLLVSTNGFREALSKKIRTGP
jgi:hypothetical protein